MQMHFRPKLPHVHSHTCKISWFPLFSYAITFLINTIKTIIMNNYDCAKLKQTDLDNKSLEACLENKHAFLEGWMSNAKL